MKINGFLSIFVLYLGLSVVPYFLSYFLFIFTWIADDFLIFTFGFYNLLFTQIFLKWEWKFSLLTSFLIASVVFIFSYLLSMISSFVVGYENFFFRLLSLSIFQGLLIYLFNKHLNSLKFSPFFLLPASILGVFVAMQMKYLYYEGKFTTKRDVQTTVTIRDQENKLRIGDTIEIREERQRLYAMQESPKIYEGITDSSGTFTFLISKKRNYRITISNTDLRWEFDEIYQDEIPDEKFHKTIIVDPKN